MFFSFVYLPYATIAAEQLLVTVYMTLHWIDANSSDLILYEPPSYFEIFVKFTTAQIPTQCLTL